MGWKSKLKNWSVKWVVLILLFFIAFIYLQSSEFVNLINLPINWMFFGIMGAFLFVYKELHSKISERKEIFHILIFLPASIFLCFLLTPIVTDFLGLQDLIAYPKFFFRILNSLKSYWWVVVGFGIGAAFADQILHWVLFGRGKSEFTLGAAFNGRLLDEVFMRALLLGVLLGFGLEINSAIFLHALSYTLYYLDPFSQNRRKEASLNTISGLVLGSLTLTFGWVFGVGLIWLITLINFIRFHSKNK